MRKSTVLQLILAVSCCFICIQFILVPFLFDQDSKKALTSDESVHVQVVRYYEQLGLRLFLIDPDILQTTLTSSDTVETLLRGKSYVTFGLLHTGQIETKIERHTVEIQSLGFTVTSSSAYCVTFNRTLPTHYFLVSDTLTVHIVVFFRRTPLTLWHSQVSESDLPLEIKWISKQTFARSPGIFNKFDVIRLDSVFVPNPVAAFVEAVPTSTYIECDHHLAQQFLSRYPQDDSTEARKFKRKARQTIARAKQYLDDLGIRFWLSSGSCLGWFRQCDIISYSKDVDLGIWIIDYRPELIAWFERGGFYLKHVFGKVSDSYELSFQAGDVKLDLFFFYEETDHMWNGGTHHLTGQKYKYIFPKFSLCWTVFLDLKVRIPCPPQPYIEANYGTNWMEPVENWEWNKSPPNVRENGFWPKEEWSSVIQVF